MFAGNFELDIDLSDRRDQSKCSSVHFARINVAVRRPESHDSIIPGHLAPFHREGIDGIDNGYALTRELSKDFSVFFGSFF